MRAWLQENSELQQEGEVGAMDYARLHTAHEKQHLALKCGVVVLKREKAGISHLVARVSSWGHKWDS